MLYHITYVNRYTGRTHTGKVGVSGKASEQPASELRRRAIQAAGWKFPNAKRASISAVRIAP